MAVPQQAEKTSGSIPVARRGVMLVIASPSGAGKTSISRAMLASDPELELSISVTTRTRRPSEKDGVHYHFISVPEFERLRADGELLEWAEVHGNLYATPRANVEQRLAAGRDILFDIDWQGTLQLYKRRRSDMVTVFILPPSIRELRQRLERRAEDGPDVIRRRLANARLEMEHWSEYDHVIINEDLEHSVDQVRAVLLGARTSGRRLTQMASFVKDLQNQIDSL
ncbi:MAG TPA: guanylate kinase [Devosiaceae bacterium]|jgi:guanylate kinase|nr:guanylate kinase [Devosiaceae bacterium]